VTSGETGSHPTKGTDAAEGTGMRGEPQRRARFKFMFMSSMLRLSSSALPPEGARRVGNDEGEPIVLERGTSRQTANHASQPGRAMDE
jgi:hypothetical protein